MSKRVDHGLDKPKKKRKRPPVTSRPVTNTAAERASALQNRPGTVPHAIALGKRPHRSQRR